MRLLNGNADGKGWILSSLDFIEPTSIELHDGMRGCPSRVVEVDMIKSAWWVRKHKTQSRSESCVFSFSNPILK